MSNVIPVDFGSDPDFEVFEEIMREQMALTQAALAATPPDMLRNDRLWWPADVVRDYTRMRRRALAYRIDLRKRQPDLSDILRVAAINILRS